MPTVGARSVWMKAAPNVDASMLDIATSATPAVWKGKDTEFVIGVIEAIAGTDTVLDISTLASMTLRIKDAANPDAPAYLTETVNAAAFSTISAVANFTAKTEYHAKFVFTDDEMDLDIGGTSKNYLLTIDALTTDTPAKEVPISFTTLKISNYGSEPDTGTSEHYTKAEVDALVAVKMNLVPNPETNWRVSTTTGNLQVWNPTTSKYHDVLCTGPAGAVTLTIEQTGEA